MYKVKIRIKAMQYTVVLYGCGGPGINMMLARATYYDAGGSTLQFITHSIAEKNMQEMVGVRTV